MHLVEEQASDLSILTIFFECFNIYDKVMVDKVFQITKKTQVKIR